jgi:hypothetical protein
MIKLDITALSELSIYTEFALKFCRLPRLQILQDSFHC